MRESDIEKHLVKRVESLGGEVRKVQWIGRRGAPDRLVMLPEPLMWMPPEQDADWVDMGQTIWVELKSPGLKADPHQEREHKRMLKMGQRVVVIDSIEGVEDLLPPPEKTRSQRMREAGFTRRPSAKSLPSDE